jgi:16S rRNA (guanine527-N7)-methyltransferase
VSDADRGANPPPLLDQILSDARRLGFLGPGPLDLQRRHAEGFTAVVRRELPGSARPTPEGPGRVLDLGSGGGLPGLVVASALPDLTFVLLDANRRRTDFLADAVARLGLEDRVTVLAERAEVAGRQPSWRGQFAGVLARSFGPPATLAECAAPFLEVGGWLIVSEPPSDDGPAHERVRWPEGALGEFGLTPETVVAEEFTYQLLRQRAECPERFPRRNGMPAKRPLF